jgi:aquacobalamin reductase/NAD(P)H-flavin reductase
MNDIVSLAPYDIYMAGRFDMIGIVRDDFLAHGAIRENMFADAFAFIK